MSLITYFPVLVSLFTIAFVFFLIAQINKAPVAKDKAVAITQAIQEGAMSYLKRQYKTVAIVAVVLFFVILFAMGWKLAVGFVIGAFLSGLSGFIGMVVSTQSNTRVAKAAERGMDFALDLSFKGGLVTGLMVVSVALVCRRSGRHDSNS
jgi:K(+)-stimulated pyrophosphate-energized sodium pump